MPNFVNFEDEKIPVCSNSDASLPVNCGSSKIIGEAQLMPMMPSCSAPIIVHFGAKVLNLGSENCTFCVEKNISQSFWP